MPELSRWPAVSVVIPAWRSAATLAAAVESALAQRFDGSVEVVIAVAVSDDGTEQAASQLARHERVKVVANPSGSAPSGLNAAIRAARGEVIVRLDAHAVLPEGYVARALEVLRETGAANVGGMQVPVATGGFARAVAAAMASPLGSGGARYRVGGPPGDVDTVYLGVFRREALDEVGGFDEGLVRNQDYELNHRLRVAGHRVFFHPDLQVAYTPRGSIAALWRQFADYGAWKRHVLRRHPGSARLRQVVAPLLVLGLAAGLLLGLVTGWWWPVVVLAGLYLAALVAGALEATRGRGGLALVAQTVAAIGTMHLAWGLGFLVRGVGRSGGGPAHRDRTRGTDPADE